MLEGLVAWVLNTYLGKYVSNLNTDQLSIALLKGAVELENLPLRKDALKEFDLPFEVKAGFIGKITLQIPFYRPHSDPWVISMSQLNLIIGPAQLQEYDDEKEKEEQRERKKYLLKTLEDKFKSECEQRGESYWYSVTASVVTRIVENIELNIQDVHLRFEDDTCTPDKPFSFGVCINNISAQNPSKDTAWNPFRQKQLEIDDFRVYWDTECEMLAKLPVNQIQEAMTQCMKTWKHQYIFEPVCASVLLRRNASKEPLRFRHTPRIEGHVQLETMSIRLSQVQYQQIMAFLKELYRREREMLYRKWRPNCPISGNCKQWWIFAIQANLSEIREQRRRGSWTFALQRARDVQTYTSLYFRKLKGVPLSPQEESELERVEEEQTLEELQSLREIVHDWFRKHEEIVENVRDPSSEQQPCSPTTSIPKSGSSGMIQYLQSWFPGWGGWYGDSLDPDKGPEVLLPSPSSWDILAETDDLFDPLEDSQTLNTFTRRDYLFARLEFLLEKGGVTLFHQDSRDAILHESGVIQLEVSGVKVVVESLPRSESSLLSVKLGGLFLRDLTTHGTIFPVLVSPKLDKVVIAVNQTSGQSSSNSGSNAECFSSPVFEMLYERNPARSKFERRLEVNTSPLNIIYNPQAIKKVTEFFYKGRVHSSGFGYQSELELKVAEAARRQYDKLKRQTKAEIRQTIDQLLVGEFIENSKRWTMKLDICAPQVIFPDDFQSGDPMLVIVDLGRILLTNSQDDSKDSKTAQPQREDLSDEEYQTPLATPPESPPELHMPLKEWLKCPELPSLGSPESTKAYSRKLYERYSLSFKDLQIMVGRYKDNWKNLQESEVGPTHVVEKFNVLLQLEQRLRYTSDPQLPGAVLSGTLPDLKVHINLEKMTALRSCLARLSSSAVNGDKLHDKGSKSPDPLTLRHEKIFQREDSSWKIQGSAKNLTQSVMTLEQHTREVLVESRLLLAEFNINYMQLGVESDGRYISVLKVFGTNAHFVKRPYDAEVSLTVHGLLLVDTLQTYGSDFDLLVSSHKNLSFDIPTGSLQESQPSSPMSYDSRSSEHQSHLNESSSGLRTDRMSGLSSFLKDQEALIKLEYQFVSSDCPSMNLDSSLQVISMQVNNLDIILNPETMVELLKFLQKSFPKEENPWTSSLQQPAAQLYTEEEDGTFQSTYDQNKELTVEIHRLNLLLLRTVSTGTVLGAEKKGLKIATASITGTKVNVSLGSRMDINGSLGAMQLVDLTQEGGRSQFVVSIGNVEDTSSTCEGLPLLADKELSPSEALNFQLQENSQGDCTLHLHMASLHYNHSAKFLMELSLSANEVEDNFRSMLKSAATKVSTVLATKTAEYSGMFSLFETPSRRSRTQSQSWTYPMEDEEDISMEEPESTLDTFFVKLTLNVNIESPVVSIPRKPGHPELLVGHLGSITIQNFITGQQSEGERLQVLVKDIRLYSLNTSHLVLKKMQRGEKTGNVPPSHNRSQDEPQFTRHDFFEYLNQGKAFHILKDTTMQFTLEKSPIAEDIQFTLLSCKEPCKSTGLLRVEGKFVKPVQVFLCKAVYEQVLQTLDNLFLIEEQRVTPSQPPTPPPPTPSSTRPHRFPDPHGGLFAKDPPYISLSHSLLSSPLPLQSQKPSPHSPAFTQLKVTLHVAELQVQLSADLTQGSQGLISLHFRDLEGDITKEHPHLLEVQLILRSLLMEDLLERNPEHKHLMVSHGAPKPSTFSPKEYLSHSCPSASNVQYPDMPRSLPSHMEEAQNVFQLYQRHPGTPSASNRKTKKDPVCPSTPPPSPTHPSSSPQPTSEFDESLVHINVLLVDQSHPEFKTRYGSVGRSIDIDFNCLDVLITLQTWVVILDFFGIGSTANNHAMKVPASSPQYVPGHPLYESDITEQDTNDSVNTKLDVKVHSLSVVLNKEGNELARASVIKLSAHLEMLESNLVLTGSLGSLSLSDLTPHGDLFCERFTTRGGEALIFNIHKYGLPDPYLERQYDIKVSLLMASVQYVHTQRFQAEVVAFIQHFTQLQDVLGRQRAAMEGQAIRDRPQRASRILLDIEAGAPVIIIPESSSSTRVIVANLGQLKLENCFLPAGARGTFSCQDKKESTHNAAGWTYEQKQPKTPPSSLNLWTNGSPQPERVHDGADPITSEDHVCLLDCIALDLQQMDIFAAERLPCSLCEKGCNSTEISDIIFPSYCVRRTGGNLLKECCRLQLKVERNLDRELSHAVPDMTIYGSLSSVQCALDPEHYQLIRGLLENNLGEPVEEFLRPFNLQDPSTYTVLSGDVYTNLSILVNMMDVSLELTESSKSSGHKRSLARFNFMKSKLLFESFSNGSKSVNLVSHSLLAYDTRCTGEYKSTGGPDGTRRNVFDCILQPSKTGTNQASLQLELHYRSTRESSCFTVVLNNLRVFLIFDWLRLVQEFLEMPVKKPSGGAENIQCQSNAGTDLGPSTAAITTIPKRVKSGVVTKRSTVPVTLNRCLEVKVNVTGTEFVIVEDSSCLDTNAIILKGTTVLTYKPRLLDRPFSGSLAGIEVFSCRLGSEQETALSIVDPVNVQVELCGSPTYQSSSGLLDAFSVEDIPPLLEIQFPVLDIRLSYNDIQLFLAIAKSIPAVNPPSASDSDVVTSAHTVPVDTPKRSKRKGLAFIEGQLIHLQDLGFSKEDCKKALILCKGHLDQAATWLLENAENIAGRSKASADSGASSQAAALSGIEVKAESICICFIDDCLDCDIPLAELTFSRLNVLQRIGSTQEGNASFTLSGDYYNRELAGWEPFIEPWPCFLSWQQQAAGRLHPPRLKMSIRAKQRLDVNITSVLLEQYNTTKTSWIADYCNKDEQTAQSSPTLSWIGSSVDPPNFGQSASLSHLRTRSTASLTSFDQQTPDSRGDVKLSKKRQPFVPYALRNHTGCTMWFATLTTTPTRVALSHSSSADSIGDLHGPGNDDSHNVSQWREVSPGEEIPFEFEAREKLRHRHTHELKLHQLLVRVCGWEQVKPVSVDKVGIFFRYAAPDRNNASNIVGSPISRTNIIHPHVYFSALPPVRVVFSITMEGSARKVITVRSALILKNQLDVPMEIRLDSPSAPDKPVVLPPILPNQALAVPLHLTSWRLQARPKGLGLFFCKVPIHWTSVERPGEISSSKRDCQSADFDDNLKRNFRFCVVIKKENYPDQRPAKRVSGNTNQIYRQPGHTIFLLPTVVLANLLPCDLNYYVKGTSNKGSLKPGKEAVLHAVDTSQNMELGVLLENFPVCKELLIPPGTQNYVVRMRLYDTNKRLLCLTIRIILRAQGALKILISAPYWLINKTGLPLIFRQDNGKVDAAGQFDEHELARSLSPLLFCYTDKEQPAMCTMRVGKGIHPDGVPGWCQGFSLDGGSGVRAVKVIQHGNRPGLIYNIGISVRNGKGRYRDTHIVTFAPRYLLDNSSSHKLAFAQREFARGKGTANPEGYISTLPGSSVVFHWPRNDYDQLLCVRLMDSPTCTWSGGFEVNKPKSFHVNMRDTMGNCFFLRTEITIKGATYQISFTDTDQLPPPFRIHNISEVPIQFWQHGVVDIKLHTEVKADSELDYACDEPTLPPYLTLTVKGAGSSEVTADMNFFREYNKLYYENFIYIAATHTFSQSGGRRPVGKKHLVTCAELVLDVDTKTQRVILKKKEPGKRSQLWRMTGTGMLCHEGSSPPQSKPAQPRPMDSSLVLDIAGLAAVSDNSFEPLMLRRPDPRRSTTQTWHFSSCMLTCGLPRLVVQVRGGIEGLYDGAEVVLGPDSGLMEPGPEQQFINQKMRPGSGVLSVQVLPDGPTRVLQISDFNQRRLTHKSPSAEPDKSKEEVKKKEAEQELEVLVNLEEGIGVSLLNKVPEELVFVTLSGIDVHFTRTAANEVLEMSINNIQVDNQLLGTTQPVMLCVTPISSDGTVLDSGPALQVNSVKVPSSLMLTDIFKHLMVTAGRFSVVIEEKLLLKLLSFFGYGQTEAELEKLDENLHERPNNDAGPPKRYYFENLKISLPQVKLSVLTSHKLPADLKALKGTLGFPLVRFEDAVVNMYPFTRVHPYETQEIIINDILKHFREELISQAAQILGSVDFLGNPIGLLNDVSEGVSELIKYGNVGGLIRNVTHGVSNSAAKFAGTLSDGLGKTMDNRHQTEREYIRYHGATSGEHLVAGIHGLAHGIIGGMTSIITSTVEGVKTEGGVSGFFSGLGKGLVGTVTKPVAGALDFASETAQTVRDMASLSNHRLSVQRVRKPRCCKGPQGLLPRYSALQADGQEQLFRLTDNIQSEFFIAVEPIDSYSVLISSKVVYFLKPGDHVDREAIFLEIKYDDLYHSLVSKDHGKVYVQLTKKAESTSSGVAIPGPSHQKPMVHVKSESLAIKISQEINYAKSLYYEQQLMLPATDNEDCLLLES
ncbi:intermembrane lipid transfer protein VPS13D isoform X1 [Dunckerocampus dactyliophorus]|uniref:intermembrane lipid transfer protein VPS13D isoform X1 n=1 Tax=Dunckerocampus dactyliophorus TaxID=161453 RepID=UPI00240771A7|nr:intermembrane lipid transfer protein VPS13D isoform X1 [Dunckerocampus dactyliophorus]XP_054629825.1 intermembrane lipid transfer protein VPS13D isoform X1 [Dunckerocampus dactyliophorus]